MRRGLIAFERHKIRERYTAWNDNLRLHGVQLRFGGSGERTGIGGGITFQANTGETHYLTMLALATVRQYQELGLNWTQDHGFGQFIAEASYQWRPMENFYGLGHNSSRDKHSQFALRQTWSGVRYQIQPASYARFGVYQNFAWISALPGENPVYSSPDVFTSGLPGYGMQTRLRSTGIYFDLDAVGREYRLGGAVHAGASYQRGLGGSRLSYFTYAAQLEGRLPVVRDSCGLVAQADIQLTRARPGSDPIPFYLLPRIGGSSTLRGFALDRYYGTNLMLLALEYRYRIHPNLQAYPFFDEGQIFDRTGDLSWLNWHRNYGFGFRFRSANGTLARIEYGYGKEGSTFHVIFGDRELRPAGGALRYGVYRR